MQEERDGEGGQIQDFRTLLAYASTGRSMAEMPEEYKEIFDGLKRRADADPESREAEMVELIEREAESTNSFLSQLHEVLGS